MIRAEPETLPQLIVHPKSGGAATARAPTRAKRKAAKTAERQALAPHTPVPSWAKGSGRAGEGEALFAAGASLALLDAFLRRNPPAAGATRQRLALQAAAASARISRLRADETALRDLRFALTYEAGPEAKLLELWRDLARGPPALDARRLVRAAALLDLPSLDLNDLASRLKDLAGEGDPVSAAAKAASLVSVTFAEGRPAEAEIFALWLFDLVLAIRLRWERPLPLITTKILDPALRPPGADRRPKLDEAGWPRFAAAVIGLAAAATLDLTAELSRRAAMLLATAPGLRAKPAMTIVELLLAEDCVSSPEAARRAAMTERSARRLFERLVSLGAVRELSGRPTFRIFGL